MNTPKIVNLYLMDGDFKGRIKCETDNWIGIAYKIPKNKINESKDIDDLNKIGVYFLFGKNEENKQTIYVGQAKYRKNGNGLLGRILEPHSNKNNSDIDDWTEAILFTTKNETSLNGAKISYLENRFYNLAKQTNRYYVKNGNEPNSDNFSQEQKIELEQFVKYVKLFTEILGHKVFEQTTEDKIIETTINEQTNNDPIITKNSVLTEERIKEEQQISEIPIENDDEDTLYLKYNKKIIAKCKKINDGFLLLKDSKIKPTTTNSCPEYIIKLREEYYKNKIDDNNTLLEDIKSPNLSRIAMIVLGSSRNGDDWKDKNGKTLKELEESPKKMS